jgi:hypothetical protein
MYPSEIRHASVLSHAQERLGLWARTDSSHIHSVQRQSLAFSASSQATRHTSWLWCDQPPRPGQRIGVRFPKRFLSSLTRPGQFWDLSDLPPNWYWGALFTGVKRLGRRANGTLTFKCPKVRKEWSFICTSHGMMLIKLSTGTSPLPHFKTLSSSPWKIYRNALIVPYTSGPSYAEAKEKKWFIL